MFLFLFFYVNQVQIFFFLKFILDRKLETV